MSRRYDMGEQDSSTRGRANRRKVTVKVCMLDDSVVKFELEVRAFVSNVMIVSLEPEKIITEYCRFVFTIADPYACSLIFLSLHAVHLKIRQLPLSKASFLPSLFL